MLAEIFMLRLEAALRNADGQTNSNSDARFTPVAVAINTRNHPTPPKIRRP